MESGPPQKPTYQNFPNIAQERSQSERSPIIALKSEHRKFLITLLGAYEKELKKTAVEPEAITFMVRRGRMKRKTVEVDIDLVEVRYKVEILKKLVTEGTANVFEISKKEAAGKWYSARLFKKACDAIDRYNETGENIDRVSPNKIELKKGYEKLLPSLLKFKDKLEREIEALENTNNPDVMQIRINECVYKLAILKKLTRRKNVDNSELESELIELEVCIRTEDIEELSRIGPEIIDIHELKILKKINFKFSKNAFQQAFEEVRKHVESGGTIELK